MPGVGQSLATPNYGYSAGTNQGAHQGGMGGVRPMTAAKTVPPPMATSQKGPKGDLERLKRERAELLDAGCYSPDDPLILEMDRQIAAAQAKIDMLS